MLTPNMMHVVQSSNLGEKSSERFVVILPEIDGTGPVVAPFDHRTRFESVRSYFVNILGLSQQNLRPVTKCQ